MELTQHPAEFFYDLYGRIMEIKCYHFQPF